jgi:peptidoglycan-associated lipoprotein
MPKVMRVIRNARFAVALVAALAAAACANKANELGAGVGGGTAAPGSQQDFVVNVGDRVFFESDSTELTAQSRATLDKQAQWLSTYNRYAFIIEAMPTSAAPVSTISPSGHDAPRRCGTTSPHAASSRRGCGRSPTAKERPVAVCNDISCWSQNRRAVTVLNASS